MPYIYFRIFWINLAFSLFQYNSLHFFFFNKKKPLKSVTKHYFMDTIKYTYKKEFKLFGFLLNFI